MRLCSSAAEYNSLNSSAGKGVEDARLIFRRNPDAPIADRENGFALDAPGQKLHRYARLGVLDGIGKEVGENVAQQAFVADRPIERRGAGKADGTRGLGRREDFVGQAAAERFQVDRRRRELHATFLHLSEKQHLLHERGQVAGRAENHVEMPPAFLRRQPVEVALQDFARRQDHFERSTELM